jgi:TolB-like protein
VKFIANAINFVWIRHANSEAAAHHKSRCPNLFLFFLLLFFISPANADILTLKNGKVLENAKTIKITKDSIEISVDGKTSKFPKAMVKSLRLKPVTTKNAVGEKDKTDYEKEKIRIAETLQQTTEWEIDPERKLRVAVLNFRNGTGVEAGEVETIAEMITNSLVRTKLFLVVDKITVEKALKDNAAKCEGKNCDSTSLSSFLNTSKIITGSVTKVGKKYFINGSIIDTGKNKIDFAETAEAENRDRFSEAADYFAKKAAGGIADYADLGISTSLPDKNLPQLARSAVLPGFGQWKKGEKVKASFLFTSTLITIGFLVKANSDYTQTKAEYDRNVAFGYLSFASSTPGIGFYSSVQSNQARSELSSSANQLQGLSILLVGLYIYNLADAYYAKDKSSEINSKKLGFNLNIQNQFSKSTPNTGVGTGTGTSTGIGTTTPTSTASSACNWDNTNWDSCNWE